MCSRRSPADTLPDAFDRILPRMRCPRCAGPLALGEKALHCPECETAYPITEGIARVAVEGTVETWAAPTRAETSAAYQRAYGELDEARRYNRAYTERPSKRWSTARECRLLDRHLSTQPRSSVLLDLPSGGGRLSGVLARHTELLVEADIGFGQLLYNRSEYEGTSRVWMTASAFHIPFCDESVDGIVCCRLCHHLPTPEERVRLMRELFRVARTFVIMTFFDFHSVKNTIRRVRRPLNGLSPKMTMTVSEVADLAAEGGAELVAQPWLSRMFSGHRYALMVKR